MPAKLHSHLEAGLEQCQPPGSLSLMVDYSFIDAGPRAPTLRCSPRGHLLWLLVTSWSATELRILPAASWTVYKPQVPLWDSLF